MIYVDKVSGGLKFRGMETGALSVQSESEGMLVVHEAGHNYWSSIGEQSYAAARFHVLNVIERTETYYITREVIDFPVKKAS